MIIFTKKLRTSFEIAKQNIQNKFDSERIQMVEISKFKFDKNFMELFAQEPEKVERIAQDMREHGFDKSQPIIATKDGSILDENSRYIVFKEFADKNEALKYELHLQLDRRNLSDAEVFAMFKKLEEMKQTAKSEGKSTEDFTDAKLAEQLKKSKRQIQKRCELSKKADEQTLNKVSSGEITINQAKKQNSQKKPKPIKTLL